MRTESRFGGRRPQEKGGKKGVKVWIDRLFTLCMWGVGLLAAIALLHVFVFASFSIPSDSMEPELIPGDRILVSKLPQGARLFNMRRALQGEDIRIRRMPGTGRIARNDVVVFNFPYRGKWDKIEMDARRYYVKRCIALPGDTVAIEDARYRVLGYEGELGNVGSQERLALRLDTLTDNRYEFDGMIVRGYPHAPEVEWNSKNFGPLYVPARGSRVEMDQLNYVLYWRLIEWEQKKEVSFDVDQGVLLGDSLIGEYEFLKNYYFVAGDRTEDSQDSRYWGLLPEEFMVGKAWMVWRSVDPQTDKIRWKRTFKRIR